MRIMMKRLIDHFLLEWKEKKDRKPLLLRGARQVGKTHAAKELGKTFEHFVELNLETNELARSILEKDLDIERILLQLSEAFGELEPGKTLLFIDEIQKAPQAITALRYFYEHIPGLHVIAAGSLLDFAIEEVGMPVGRVSERYMYPLSFTEFLVALGHTKWVKAILSDKPVFEELHAKILDLVGFYLAIGGMPASINKWVELNRSRAVKEAHAEIVNNYTGDFASYAKKHQQKYLYLVFNRAMQQLAKPFKYAKVGEYKKRELEPALHLLEMAGILYRIYSASGQGIPLGAGINLDDFKTIMLDVGLTQAILKFDLSSWFIDPLKEFANKGELVEAFVGQELLAYTDPIMKEQLLYWRKKFNDTFYEVDYLIQLNQQIVPVEVKSSANSHVPGMNRFLETHLNSAYGIRFWTGGEVQTIGLHSYPLYAIVKPLLKGNEYLQEAIAHLIS